MRAPDFETHGVSAFIGDAFDLLRELEADSIDCVVTSPPYWNLRDYGTDPRTWGGDAACEHDWQRHRRVRRTGGTARSTLADPKYGNGLTPATIAAKVERQSIEAERGATCARCGAWFGDLGLEPSPVLYLAHMVELFREIWRVLTPRGTMFVNLGDSYCASRSGPIGPYSGLDGGQSHQKASRQAAAAARPIEKPNRRQTYPELGVKNKDLVGIPWRLAFALQEDRWRLRQDIIWSKPNPMPESVKDRPTKAHEYVFLFTKSERYYWNGKAIAEPVSENTHLRLSQDVVRQVGSLRANGGTRADRPMKAARPRFPTGWAWQTGRKHDELDGRYEHRRMTPKDVDGRSARMGRAPGWRKLAEHGSGVKSNESMDQALALPVDERNARSVWTILTEGYSGSHYATFPRELAARCILAGMPADGIVLDPFVGSGTTLSVCVELERRGLGFDLDPKNLPLLERRVGEAVIEQSREDPESFDDPIEAVSVRDLGPLWEGRAP